MILMYCIACWNMFEQIPVAHLFCLSDIDHSIPTLAASRSGVDPCTALSKMTRLGHKITWSWSWFLSFFIAYVCRRPNNLQTSNAVTDKHKKCPVCWGRLSYTKSDEFCISKSHSKLAFQSCDISFVQHVSRSTCKKNTFDPGVPPSNWLVVGLVSPPLMTRSNCLRPSFQHRGARRWRRRWPKRGARQLAETGGPVTTCYADGKRQRLNIFCFKFCLQRQKRSKYEKKSNIIW